MNQSLHQHYIDGALVSEEWIDEPPWRPTITESLMVAVRATVDLDALSDTQVAEVAAIYPDWTAGATVTTGDVYARDSVLYRSVTGHDTQTGWEPPATPALWTPVRQTGPDAGAIDPWVQPTGSTDAYMIGDHVMFEGTEYVSAIDANVYSPTDYPAGWTAAP